MVYELVGMSEANRNAAPIEIAARGTFAFESEQLFANVDDSRIRPGDMVFLTPATGGLQTMECAIISVTDGRIEFGRSTYGPRQPINYIAIR